MVDFVKIATEDKKDYVVVFPKFIIKKSKDLMIRGGDFYAVWVEDRNTWSTDEEDVIRIVDDMIKEYIKGRDEDKYSPKYMWDASSGSIDAWHKYVQKQSRDNFHSLDEELIFDNTETSKESYSSRKLSYPLEPGETKAWDTLIGTLYSPEERRKIEWAIGSIVAGDSKNIQKFLVLYGSAGTGKSTILNVIQMLFEGYYSVFDAKALGQSSNSFALEAFRKNPLVAIQHDGDLSHIEDNTRLNSLVSHELMTVNEKFKSSYENRFNAFLFMGTNKPVKITDAKSGLIRRLIDVTPSGNKLPVAEYNRAVAQVKFELGQIAYRCLKVYERNPGYYDEYVPINMMGSTNDFFNFVEESYLIFKKEDGTTLNIAWNMYKEFCEEAKVPYALSRRAFKEELKNYFYEYKERGLSDDGGRTRNVYTGFRTNKFDIPEPTPDEEQVASWIEFKEQESIFDKEFADCLAQPVNDEGTPTSKWEYVKSKLRDIDTSLVHYVRVPEYLIVIDFDIPGEDGRKNFEMNLKEASKWPETYAELSKSEGGIHLHYIYKGDVSKLSRVYKDHIEIKVFTGLSSLRRKLTKCNDKPIVTISSGLPFREEKKRMIDNTAIQSDIQLKNMIVRCLNKEFEPHSTKTSIDFMTHLFDEAYESGVKYDLSTMRQAILTFAASSSHNAEYCVKAVGKMKFRSDEPAENIDISEAPIAFYDIEVFPNLFIVNYKLAGDYPVIRMINPTPSMIEEMLRFRLIGFNCRRYDNHLIYACMMGYDNQKLYELSQRIISGSKEAFFGNAWNLSYTDVYDFASAGNKMSLKKHEIRLGIHHLELGLPWDKPVDPSMWEKVAEYCDNDVLATEAVFNDLKGDWTARQILADLAESTVNDTTNSLTTKIIFGKNKTPQNEFNYRHLSEPVFDLDEDIYQFLAKSCPKMMESTHGPAGSLLPYFKGYEFKNGKSTYRGHDVGEGGFVYSEPGIYGMVALLDVVSMHPHSLIAECLFGVRYTKAFQDIVEGRVSIKHQAWDEVNGMLDGKLTKWIEKVKNGEMKAKDLANGLKTAVNSVYGLTSAKFTNPFKDENNKDNIVAKRGALFMIDLLHAVQERGFTVAHIKTDSIKIPDATPEIIQFVMEFGERYGYTFEHEATYERMCLVNKAVYIAKYADKDRCQEMYGYIPGDNYDHGNQWTATGDQFAVPYVFKTLFTKEPLVFNDFCETFQVKQGDLYLDMNESIEQLSPEEEKELECIGKAWDSNDQLSLEKVCKKYGYDFEQLGERYSELWKKESNTHDLHFVGRVGRFTPIVQGAGGGILYRRCDEKNYAAAGSTGYRWMESEMVESLGKTEDIDKSFYRKLADDAIAAIDVYDTYGGYDWFVSDDPYILPEYVKGPLGNMIPEYNDTLPFA